MWAKTGMVAAALWMVCGMSYGQTSLGELDAAQAGQAQLNGGSVTGGANPGYINRAQNAANQANAALPPTGTLPNPAGGLTPPAPMGAPAAPGAMQPVGPVPGGAPRGATPAPVATIKVLVGKRVYCAVCGSLLEDAVQLAVPQSDQDRYLDDGVHDNGIANDGIRGNVETSKNQYIGPECNMVKDRLINSVRRAEQLSPMEFFRYHVMSLDSVTGGRQMPALLDKEAQRDEVLRDWNSRFLADFRVKKDDPKSEFFQLYVPEPPQVPMYPVPPGYTSPQQLRGGGPAGAVPGVPAGPGAPTTAGQDFNI